jgi:aspartyl protease family protein
MKAVFLHLMKVFIGAFQINRRGQEMGFTYVRVRVSNPLKTVKFKDIDLLVDSGAVFTSIPRKVLEELDLSPIDRERLRVYGGATVERDIGWALVEYGGKRRVVPVIFGEGGDAPVLGATTLEALGYQVDPVTKRLKPVEFLMV